VRCLAHDNTQSGSPVSTQYFDQGAIIGGTAYYYVRDELGSVMQLVTSTGTIASQFTYDPYGNRTTVSGTASDIGYAGYFSHAVSGLDFTLYRAYDPTHARWLNRDPIGESGGINLYAYATGNPISNRDPTGLYCQGLLDNTTYCEYPDGPSFIVPTPDGFPNYFDSGNPLYHSYDVTRSIGCDNPDDVIQGLVNSPTPGSPSPATPGGTPNNAVVAGQPNRVTSYLTTDLTTGNPLVVNITGPNSLFAPGYVARTVTDGVAHTYGEGLSAKQSTLLSYLALGPLGLLFQEIAEQTVWGSQMSSIISQAKCACSK
jgi:RHS repeat-associated protein